MSTTAAAATPRVVNPYAKPAQNAVNMGRQSQQRVSNQTKQQYKKAKASPKKRKGDQLTLDNQVAFQSERDCIICKAKEIKKFLPSYTIPKRAHNVLCILNKKTLGKGELSKQSLEALEDNKRYKTITSRIRPEERYSGKHITKAAGATYVAARTTTTTITKTMTEVVAMNNPQDEAVVTPLSLSETVGKLVESL